MSLILLVRNQIFCLLWYRTYSCSCCLCLLSMLNLSISHSFDRRRGESKFLLFPLLLSRSPSFTSSHGTFFQEHQEVPPPPLPTRKVSINVCLSPCTSSSLRNAASTAFFQCCTFNITLLSSYRKLVFPPSKRCVSQIIFNNLLFPQKKQNLFIYLQLSWLIQSLLIPQFKMI